MSAQVAERRSLGAMGRMGLVVALHVGLLFVIGRPMILKAMEVPEDVIAEFLPDERLPDDPLPKIEPVIEPPDRITLIEPKIPPVSFLSIDDPHVDAGPPPDFGNDQDKQGSADLRPMMLGVRQDSRYPLSQPPYPAVSRRLGEEGVVDVELYVLPTGRVGEVRVARSTGFERLDQAAVDQAKKRWRLRPATRDGEAIAQWYRMRVVFQLKSD